MKEKLSSFFGRIKEFVSREKVKKNSLRTVVVILALVVLFMAIPILPKAPYALRMVTSNSMEPVFSAGSLVTIAPQDNYEVGDIVTYQASEYEQDIVTHRIIKEGKGYFVTKGDANSTADDREVTKESIHGKVLFSIPWAGYVIDFIRKPLGFILVVAIPALIIILGEFKNIFSEAKTKFKKK